jgi:hypothetical protein
MARRTKRARYCAGSAFLIGGSTLHGAGAYIAIAGLLIYTGSFAIGLGRCSGC